MSIPRAIVLGLERASASKLEGVVVSPAGAALSWPSLDVDVYVPGLVEGNGVIERYIGGRPNVTEYVLTEAGSDLAEVIKHLGAWAIKWVFNDPNRDELDPALFLWKMHQRVNHREFPRRRTVVQFDLTGRKDGGCGSPWYRETFSSSLKPPGFESDLIVRADVSVLYRVWAGFVDYDAAVRRREILLEGPPALVQAFPRWFMWSPLVDVASQYREHRRVSA